MFTTTDGQLCYGFLLPEEIELPWERDNEENEDFDEIDWWVKELNFKPSKEIYTEGRTEHLKGITKKDITKYYREKRKFLESNPLPFELVNCCSIDYPKWILAVPNSVFVAKRG